MGSNLPPVPYGSPPGSSYWNDWYEKLRTLINTGTVTVLWANINFAASNITSIVNRAHNNLQSIQGGAPGDYNHITSAQLAVIGVGNHNNLNAIQGGLATERYHLTSAQQTAVAAGVAVVITTAKLTVGGANGSMTFTNGILTAQTAAT